MSMHLMTYNNLHTDIHLKCVWIYRTFTNKTKHFTCQMAQNSLFMNHTQVIKPAGKTWAERAECVFVYKEVAWVMWSDGCWECTQQNKT